jgi:hypothetical protein
VIFAIGFIKVYRKDKRLFLLAASSTFPIVAGYFLLTYLGKVQDPGGGFTMGGYKSYKLLSFFLPLLLLGLSLAFRDLNLRSQTGSQYVLSLGLIILLGCNAVSCYLAVRHMAASQTTLDKNLSDLGRIEYSSQVQSINIVDSDVWRVMWKVNFLLRKKLFFRRTPNYKDPGSGGEWDLKPIRATDDDLLDVGFEKDEPIPVNASYMLERAEPLQKLSGQLGEGWYGSEGTHIWMGNQSDSATVVLQCAEANLTVDLRLKYSSLNSRNSLIVYLNEKKIADCNGKQCEIDGATLLKGLNILRFQTSLPPERPGTVISGSNDKRTLSYAFQSIRISATKPVVATSSAAQE